jgi:hypothetical protein
VSGPASEALQTAPFVKEQQSRAALLLVVQSGHVPSGDAGYRSTRESSHRSTAFRA